MAGDDSSLIRLADQLEERLRGVGTPERAVHEKAYLKSTLAFLGASVPQIRAAATELRGAHPDLGADDLRALVEQLWGRGIHECRVAAVELLAASGHLLSARDLPLLERLLRDSRTWALTDALAVSVVGRLAERDPEVGAALDRWAGDEDFWLRRSAMLALLPGLRRGAGDFDRFSGYADRMLDEREFFIRKAIGWVLRETGRRRPELVVSWLAPRAPRASGVTMREAVKHLPEHDRDALLRAYRARQANHRPSR
ncbi:MAG TPA: DNA alkylation repair protein [Egibacteraceae bacterium]|nr:DNA alkylation repair protein [Egibacteraceae bacterium]